jgi:hypothetical protein
MKACLLSLALFLTFQCLKAQEETAHHREVYAAINAQEKSLKPVKAIHKEDELTFELKGWKDGDELKKILVTVPGEDGDGSEEFYLENGKPLFVFSHYRTAGPKEGKAPQRVENRFYFKDGKLFKWLSSERKEVAQKDPDFASEATRLTSNFDHFVAAFKGKDAAPDKPAPTEAKAATGTFTGIEQGDYAHWLMKTQAGEELSYFILKGDESVAKVLAKPKAFIGRRCRVKLKTSMEDIPEAGGKVEIEQVLGVEWLDGK